MKFLGFLLFCGTVSASSALTTEEIKTLVTGDQLAFTQALDTLEGQNLRRFFLRGEIPGSRVRVPSVFHVVARLSPAEVTQLFLRAAIQDPILGFTLVAGMNESEPDYYIPLSLVLELVLLKDGAARALRALSRVFKAYESLKSVDQAALQRFDERIFQRLGRLLGQYPPVNQEKLIQLVRTNNNYLDKEFSARLRKAFVRADQIRCVMPLIF